MVGTSSKLEGAYWNTRNADVFGQLLTHTAMDDVVTKVENTKEMKYSVWSSGMLRANAVRTLEEIVETPFVSSYYQLESRTLS